MGDLGVFGVPGVGDLTGLGEDFAVPTPAETFFLDDFETGVPVLKSIAVHVLSPSEEGAGGGDAEAGSWCCCCLRGLRRVDDDDDDDNGGGPLAERFGKARGLQ